MTDVTKIKVAIIGGGLAGATLANALLKHAHLDVNIFESAPEFSERGAAVGISINGQSALAEIGGPITDVVERAGGVVMASSRILMGIGPNAMEKLFDLASEQRGKIVFRATLLTELLKPLDASRTHKSKKVLHIDETDDSQLVIHFEDGTTFTADAIVGADGVHGHIRSHVLGEEHPAIPAKRSEFWDARTLVSIDKAKAILGEELFDVHRQYGYIGDGGFFMHDGYEDGARIEFVLSGLKPESWGQDEWSKKLDRVTLEKAIEGWFVPHLRDKVVDVMLENPDLRPYPQEHHDVDAPTYAKGTVCMMGDAADCMTPWQGSGASMAFEDAMILDVLLGHVKAPSQVVAAFKAYDEVRRPRTQRTVHSSAGTGLIICGREPETGVSMEKILELLPLRWGFLYMLDQAEHKRDAEKIFEDRLQSNKV